jgi:hypothetical protein
MLSFRLLKEVIGLHIPCVEHAGFQNVKGGDRPAYNQCFQRVNLEISALFFHNVFMYVT